MLACWFRLQYMELNGREGSINPWSIRHTAIYHKLEQDGKQHIIVINPCKNSVFEQKLRDLRLDQLYDHEMMMDIHTGHIPVEPAALLLLLLLDTYLNNWRAYKAERWHAYERVVSIMLTRLVQHLLRMWTE